MGTTAASPYAGLTGRGPAHRHETMTPHRRIALILAVLMGTACQAAETAAQQPGDQQAAELPHRVFDQDLPEYGEPYANFWDAYPLDQPAEMAKHTSTREFLVRRDGKEAELVAHLNIDCKDMSHHWAWGVQYGSEMVAETELAEIVPREVVGNIKRKYCTRR